MIEKFNVALIIFAIGYLIAYIVYLIKTKEGVIMTELKQKADNYYFKKYIRTLDIGEEERQKAITEAYIAGAIENGIQWHDLRKDPKDLPKEEELYLVFGYTNKREKFYELDVFEPTEGEFLGCGEYVYAWCEIPQFKE